jgi:hypothetical protein
MKNLFDFRGWGLTWTSNMSYEVEEESLNQFREELRKIPRKLISLPTGNSATTTHTLQYESSVYLR